MTVRRSGIPATRPPVNSHPRSAAIPTAAQPHKFTGASDEQEGMKAELNGTQLQSLRSKMQPLVEQETELLKQRMQEQEQLQSLQTKLKQLKAESGGDTPR